MNLTIDFGNTSVKVVVFNQKKPILRKTYVRFGVPEIRVLLSKFPLESSIISSVVNVPVQTIKFLKEHTRFTRLTTRISLPVKVKYKTPATLGIDRLSSAIGAAALFPGKNILIIDAGTCIKYDFINKKKEYLGGSISPGMNMRLNALHKFTGKLPLVNAAWNKKFIGQTTRESLQTGVLYGMQNEINGFINMYKKSFSGLQVVLTGGDSACFAGRLNFHIFAASYLVNAGLNEILLYHAKK